MENKSRNTTFTHVIRNSDINHVNRTNTLKRISEEEFYKLPIVYIPIGEVKNRRLGDDLEVYCEFDPGMYINLPIYVKKYNGGTQEYFGFRITEGNPYQIGRLRVALYTYETTLRDSDEITKKTRYELKDKSLDVTKDNLVLIRGKNKERVDIINKLKFKPKETVLPLYDSDIYINKEIYYDILNYYVDNINSVDIALITNKKRGTTYSPGDIRKILSFDIFKDLLDEYIENNNFVKEEFIKGRIVNKTTEENIIEEVDEIEQEEQEMNSNLYLQLKDSDVVRDKSISVNGVKIIIENNEKVEISVDTNGDISIKIRKGC